MPFPSHGGFTPTLKQRLGGRSLYLVGMMGSGKTSTGRPLAERLGYGFVDADAVIEQAAGCGIPGSLSAMAKPASASWKARCSAPSTSAIRWWWPPAAAW